MIPLSAAEIARVAHGRLLAGPCDALATSVAIDSRFVEPGAAFLAFDGENVDGHAFAADAVTRGARVVVATRDDVRDAMEVVADEHRADVAIVRVDDATSALQSLAAYHRERLSCPVVAITGSSGKTTTKDLLRSVLATRMDVVATEGNRNNELGVPLTLLAAGEDTGAVVVEMAMRGPGQIEHLCRIARPTAGLVTNVGETHIELLGSEQAIALAKAELVREVPASGRVFLNGDDKWARMMSAVASAPVTFYGATAEASVRAEDITSDESGLPSFVLHTADGSVPVTLSVPGRHNAYNAAAAAAVGLYLGLSLTEVAQGLAAARTSAMRMQVFETADGVTVIDDAYNANPAAMRAALRTLADFSATGRHIAVLGDMGELGDREQSAHEELGEVVAGLGIDMLVTVGERARRTAESAVRSGMAAAAVHQSAEAEDALRILDETLGGGDVVLVKASRCMGLEAVVEGLVEADV